LHRFFFWLGIRRLRERERGQYQYGEQYRTQSERFCGPLITHRVATPQEFAARSAPG